MTKRSPMITIIIAAILSLVLVKVMMNLMNFSVLLMVMAIFTYFCNIIFIEADAYFLVKRIHKEYHLFATLTDISALGFQSIVYYLLGNIRGMEVLELIIVLVLGAIFAEAGIIFIKLKNKYCPYVFPEDWN